MAVFLEDFSVKKIATHNEFPPRSRQGAAGAISPNVLYPVAEHMENGARVRRTKTLVTDVLRSPPLLPPGLLAAPMERLK